MPDVSPQTAVALFPAVIGTVLSIVGFVIKLKRDARVRRAAREIEEALASPPDKPAVTLPVPLEVWDRLEKTVREEADWKVKAHLAKWDGDELRRRLTQRDQRIAELELEKSALLRQVQSLREQLQRKAPNALRAPAVPVGRPRPPVPHPLTVAPGDRPTRRPVPRKGPEGDGPE